MSVNTRQYRARIQNVVGDDEHTPAVRRVLVVAVPLVDLEELLDTYDAYDRVEAQALSFARVVISGKAPPDEIRALAEQAVAQAKARRR